MIIRRTVTALMSIGMMPMSAPAAISTSWDPSGGRPAAVRSILEAAAGARAPSPTNATRRSVSTKTTYTVYQYLKPIKDFSDINQAMAYAKQLNHSVVRNATDQSVVWTNYINRYVVVFVDGKSSYYKSLAQAQADAAKTPSTYVIDACLWKTVWRNSQVYAFQVVDANGAVLQWFLLLDDAKRMAQSIPRSRVLNIAAHKTVFVGPAAYTFAVLDAKGTALKLFTDENSALNYAKTVVQSEVQSLADKTIVWQYPEYEVFSRVSYDVLASYATLNEAVAYAKTVNQSYVVLIKSNKVVWISPDSSSNVGSNTTISTGDSSDNTAENSTGDGSTDVGNSTGNPSGTQTNSGLPTTYYSVSNGVVYKHLPGGYSYAVGPAASFMKNGQNYATLGTKFYLVAENGAWQYVGNYESPYREVDLRTGSKINAAQIKAFIQSNNSTSPLASLGEVYIQAQQEFGVSAEYLVAHSIEESAYGTSQIAHDKNNLFGYSAFDRDPYNSATTFPSKAYAILYEAWFVRANYLEPDGLFYNGSNLDGMNVKYATDPNWSESIAAIMWKMVPYHPADYTNQPIPPTNSKEPFFPYAPGTNGTVTANQVNVRSQPSVLAAVYTQLNTGASVSLTGWAPGWYQILLPDKRTAYMASPYVKPSNLGKIIGDTVNIRSTPSLSGIVVEQANYGDQLIMLSTSTDGQWMQVKLMDGKKGYVSAKYVGALK